MTIEEDAQNKLSSLGISELMEHMRELGESKQSIDEGCVGCCKVVDIAADLQKKLDECKLALDLARTTHGGTIKYLRGVCDTRDNTIEELESDIDTKNEVIDGLYERIHNQANSIDGLIKNDERMNTVIEGLKAELSAREDDSAALSKVVDIIMNESVDNVRATLLVAEVVDDYLDAPEDTPIDETNEITVTFAYLELP